MKQPLSAQLMQEKLKELGHPCQLGNDIVVGVEIRFEQIRFPAVTICNMNPYKNSLARQSSSIKSALESFESAIERSTNAGQLSTERRKRSIEVPPLRPAHVYCKRDHDHYVVDPEGDERCVP
ncbi:hypothetical protein TELCIR_04983 [Teladorsagia circumcincta]|uniref:Uncharacterized protein n=1 Tax=Teladorsagia circumcincta TaxID=45464 RepID=A0A2G9UTH8_TELCI|nr:hypothetical protein TELCIR_04983 [Teladorsagia circumcincta]